MESDLVTLLTTIQDRLALVRFIQWLGSTQRRVCKCPESDMEEWTPIEYPTTRLLDEYFDMDTKAAGEECQRRSESPEGLDPVWDELLRRESVKLNST